MAKRVRTERVLQSTLFWGCISIFIALVLVVIAASFHDARWLLFFAAPFAWAAIWEFSRQFWPGNKRRALRTTGAGAMVITALLLVAWYVLKPDDVSQIVDIERNGARLTLTPAPSKRLGNGQHVFPIFMSNSGGMEVSNFFMELSNPVTNKILSASEENDMLESTRRDMLGKYKIHDLLAHLSGGNTVPLHTMYEVGPQKGVDDDMYKSIIDQKSYAYNVTVFLYVDLLSTKAGKYYDEEMCVRFDVPDGTYRQCSAHNGRTIKDFKDAEN